jgi:P-type conjugative transfer protein TrbG
MRREVWAAVAVVMGVALVGVAFAQTDTTDGDPVAIAAREARSGWSARTVRTGDAVVFPFGRVQPKVTCAPLRACVIALEPGEVVLGKASGDAERWLVDQTATGQGGRTALIVVKPTACNLVTNLVVSTDRRVYDVSLVSAPCAGPAGGAASEYTRMVRFYYPDSLVTRGQASGAAEILAASEDAVRPEDLRFGYSVKVDKHARWAPIAVYDDGVHTYIRLPDELSHGPLPILRAVTERGAPELMNYAVVGNGFVTDRVVERAELVMASDDGRRVEILNTHLGATR